MIYKRLCLNKLASKHFNHEKESLEVTESTLPT